MAHSAPPPPQHITQPRGSQVSDLVCILGRSFHGMGRAVFVCLCHASLLYPWRRSQHNILSCRSIYCPILASPLHFGLVCKRDKWLRSCLSPRTCQYSRISTCDSLGCPIRHRSWLMGKSRFTRGVAVLFHLAGGTIGIRHIDVFSASILPIFSTVRTRNISLYESMRSLGVIAIVTRE